MDAQLKSQWTDSLRNGQYAQARHVLATTDGALDPIAVLCSIQGQNTRELEGAETCLPLAARSAGLSYEQAGKIAVLNDRGATFPQIADWIDANL